MINFIIYDVDIQYTVLYFDISRTRVYISIVETFADLVNLSHFENFLLFFLSQTPKFIASLFFNFIIHKLAP